MQKIIVLREPNVHRAEIESVGTVISEVRNDATKYYALLVDVPDQRVSLLSQICTCNEKHVKAIHDNYEVKAFFLDYPVSAELVDARQILRVEEYWNTYGTKGSGVKVGVVDTGSDWQKHPDLIGQVIAAKSFVSGEDETSDLNGHGTHVSGTIAGNGKASNGKYSGIAPDSHLFIAKGLSGSGSGSLFGIIQGYNWSVQQGAQIMSLSLGGGPASCPVDDALAQAFDAAAQNQGVVTCKASGNSGNNSIDATVQAAQFSINCGAATKNRTIANFTSRRDPDSNCSNPRAVPDVYGIGVNLIAPRSTTASIGTPLPENPSYMALSGTCLVGESFVYTEDGPVEIADLSVGETVYSFDNSLVSGKCVAVIPQGSKQVFDLGASGKHLLLTENHPLLKLSSDTRTYSLDWTALSTLRKGDKILLTRQLPEHVSTELSDTIDPMLAKWLGHFLGDGWVSFSTKRTQGNHLIAFAQSEYPSMDAEYREIFKHLFGKELKHYSRGRWYYAYSKRLALALQLLGFHARATEKDIPRWLFHLPKESIIAFISGFCDADGADDRYGSVIEVGSENLVKTLKALCDYVGINASSWSRTRNIKPPSSKEEKEWKSFCLRIGTKRQPMGISSLGYKTNTLANASVMFDTKYFRLARVKSVKSVGEQEVFDISVAPTVNFLANGIVVHNSMGTPTVAGVCALLLSKFGKIDPVVLRNALIKAGAKIGL